MKQKATFHYLFLMTTTLLTIVSCGENKNKSQEVGFAVNQQVSATRDLNDAERAIATRVCYAYQSKASSFKTQAYNGGTFNFSLESKNCEDIKDIYSVSGSLITGSDGSLTYDSKSPKKFFPKIQTSQSGFLSQLCSKIVTNQAISNTAVINNVIVQIILQASDLDTYTLNYYQLQDKVLRITSADTYKVRTQFNLNNGQILGMDEKYSQQAVCSDNKNFSQISQSFTSFVAP